MNDLGIETEKLSWLQRFNLFYGVLGLILLSQTSSAGAWKSFAFGWVIAVINLELLKRIGAIFLAFYKGEKVHPLMYGFMVAKFCFWGMVMALFSLASAIQAVPFVLGTLTLIVAVLALGVREFIYAR